MAPHPAFQSGQETIAELRSQLADQASLIQRQASALAHNREIFERASIAAKIGVWECTLDDEMLHWSDGVYEIFDLPKRLPITRNQILRCYPDDSRIKMETLRRKAIEDRTGFTLDVEIITAKGRHRWIRLTATIECHDGMATRIFGIKQDITEEKKLLDKTRYLAEFDALTGLANRSQFQARLADTAKDGGTVSGLLLIDVDRFKAINDTYGHMIGDQFLIETARRLRAVSGETDLVARIGGDEFAILLRPGMTPRTIHQIGKHVLAAFSDPFTHSNHVLQLSVSVGLSEFTGQTATELFVQADSALYAAKGSGRKTLCVFDDGIERRLNLPLNAA